MLLALFSLPAGCPPDLVRVYGLSLLLSIIIIVIIIILAAAAAACHSRLVYSLACCVLLCLHDHLSHTGKRQGSPCTVQGFHLCLQYEPGRWQGCRSHRGGNRAHPRATGGICTRLCPLRFPRCGTSGATSCWRLPCYTCDIMAARDISIEGGRLAREIRNETRATW